MYILWSNLTAPFRDQDAAAVIAGHAESRPWPEEVQLEIHDIMELVRNGFLVEVLEGDIKGWCRSFTVTETAKSRRRWTLHPKIFNDASEGFMPDSRAIPFPTPEDLIKKIVRHQHGICADFTWFFGQFSCSTGCFFTIKKDGRFFAPSSVPTGARQPPLFAQILTLSIVKASLRNFEDQAEGDAYIDNVRFLGSKEALTKIVEQFYSTVDFLNITVNEPKETLLTMLAGGQSSKYLFLGMDFDHENQTVHIGPKSRSKLQGGKDVPRG
jgi:hypothetical protein